MKELAQIVVEEGEVRFYGYGVDAPVVLLWSELKRITINLRDPAGPCAWIERKPLAPTGPSVKDGPA
jgi:hypothetical protein